ncbi:hypothetical protein SCHPADRAFT_632288 [Schizopora paradoxa]|uniref:NACHT domain-containing protein n=1 Tax=Schizopora paradoxa TaxID=27342 RepID=A0A0H2RE47_9AGAM|nr:hypothetical protein SCHPADRAFT_632288 [Schizopora paradoxa]
MPKFSFSNFACWRFGRRRLRDVILDETEVVHGGAESGEANAQASPSREEAPTQEHSNRTADVDLNDSTHDREKSPEATKEFLAVGPADEDENLVQGQGKHPASGGPQSDSKHQEEFLEAVRISLAAGETITSALPFPGSDIVFSVLGGIVERVQTTRDNKETKETLLQRLRDLQTLLPKDDPSHWPEESLSALRAFKSKIIEQLQECVDSSKSRSKVTKYIFANLDKGKLSALDGCVARAVENFQTGLLVGGVNTGAQTKQGVHNLDEKVDAQTQLLFEQALREVVSRLPQLATYDSQRPRPIDVCYGETCNAILEEIKAWADKDGQPQMMWISGLAGTGKSTVAKTIATWAAAKGILGGNYFFSRDMMELRKSSHVIPTIAYHLSAHDDSLTKHISKALVESNGHVLNQEITEQLRKLIEEPLRLANDPSISRKRTVLIIDGIDECDNPKDVETIIHCLSRLLSSPDLANTHIRILLVSRPEKHIREALLVHNQLMIRYSVEDFVQTSDIEVYIHNKMSTIVWRNWPSEDDFNALVKSCGKLFIYASTAIGFIGDGRALRTPEESLQIILNIRSDDALDDMPYKQLDDLYSRILLEAVGNNAKAESKGMVRFRKILGSIVLLRDPLSVNSLSKLIEEEEGQIWNALKHLGSILIVPSEEDFKTPVRFFHPSLLDFLIDVNRCNEKFFIDVSRLEANLFQRCVDVIVSKSLLGSVDEDFIPVMRYVCQYWGYHLEKVQDKNAQVVAKLDKFVRHHLLKWFRFARVLLRTCDPLFRCMEVARKWALATKSNYSSELSKNLGTMLQSSWVLNDGLSEVYAPTYDAARSQCGNAETRRAACHPETRKAVLEEIKEWATADSTGPNVFWLHGSALTGKSAVAMSIAEWADEKGFLCSGFFFRNVVVFRGSSELGTVICTISHDLASFNLAMRGLVVEALERNEDLRYSEDAELQFDALIAKPLLSLKQDSSAKMQAPILLIVDGLEWCEGATELLALFFTHLAGPNSSHIRILFTSRPAPHILKTFEEFKGLHRSFNLNEVPAEVVRQDIETYFCDGLTQIHETLGLSCYPNWPDRADLDSLVSDSRNSFVYAKYALKFIGNSKAQNPEVQLRNWLLKSFDGESFKDIFPHWVAELAIGAPPNFSKRTRTF